MALIADPNWKNYSELLNKKYPNGAPQVWQDPQGFNDWLNISSKAWSPEWLEQDAIRVAREKAQSEASFQNSGPIGTIAPLALGAAGLMVGLPPVWAGALGGSVGGLSSKPEAGFGEAITGGAKGAALAYAGGEIAKGVSNAAVYQPNVADSIWSESATPTSSWLTQAGINAGTNAATNIGKSTISNLFGDKPQTNTRTGGTMPTLSNLLQGNGTLTDYASAAAPFLSAWQTNQQKNRMGDVYDRATNLIQTPSPDQAKYRGMLSDLLTKPASFYDNPVYQSQFEQGRQALERSQSARGNLGSGGAMAELLKYGMGHGANQFNTMASLLSGLSGVTGDQQARAAAAAAMLRGNEATNAMEAATLGRIGQGFGVQSPEEKIFRDYLAKIGGGAVSNVLPGIIGGTDYSAIQDWTSPVFQNNASWENLTNWFDQTPQTENFFQYTPDYTDFSNLAGSQSDYLSSLLGY